MQENGKTSKISGFYKLSVEKRREIVKDFADLSDNDVESFSKPIDIQLADTMIENVLGTFELPLGVAVNFRINDKDVLVPMVVEESSVVAAASNAARIARIHGGFHASVTDP